MPRLIDEDALESGHSCYGDSEMEKPDWEIKQECSSSSSSPSQAPMQAKWKAASHSRNASRDFSTSWTHAVATKLNSAVQQLKSSPAVRRWSGPWSNGLRPMLSPPPGGAPPPLRRTAYLDGLRGFAALIVYFHHHQLWTHEEVGGNPIFENSFGFADRYYFAAMPFVRNFFTGGHYAVTVFFVISGYVLSAKPLSLIHAGEYVKLGDNIGSALFRRWLRLYIPVVATTFCYLTSWHLFAIWTAESEREPSYLAEVWKWYSEFKNFSFLFNSGGEPWFSYNFHAWSIPVEFRGSLVIYTCLLAFSRCTRNMRLAAQLALIFYFMYVVDGWYCALFVSGMLLCDLDLLAADQALPRFFYRLEPMKELLFTNLFFLSLYLGGVPSVNNDVTILAMSPGWHYLSLLKPQAFFDYKWFYLIFAAVFLVSSVPRIPWLKTFFESTFNQYLGRISFSLYLIHGPVLWVLGDRLYAAVGWHRATHALGIPAWVDRLPISGAGPLGLEPRFWLPHLVLLPVTLWLANLATMVFDESSVRFTSWLYGRTQARFDRM